MPIALPTNWLIPTLHLTDILSSEQLLNLSSVWIKILTKQNPKQTRSLTGLFWYGASYNRKPCEIPGFFLFYDKSIRADPTHIYRLGVLVDGKERSRLK
jgi:hypothetical protein